MKSLLKVGIVGAGRMGRIHAENIYYRIPQAQLVAICTAHPGDKDWLQRLNVKTYTDFAKMLAEAALDAVVICSPSNLHVQHLLLACEANNHVFCEKPLSLKVNEYQTCLTSIEKAKIIFQEGYNRLFDKQFFTLKQRVLNGEIGEPQIMRITSRDPQLPSLDYLKSSGGMLFDQTIHDFAMANYLIDSSVVEVYAQADTLIDKRLQAIHDIDTVVISLKFANGCVGVIDNSRQAVYGYDQRVEVFGNRGSLSVDNCYENKVKLYNKDSVQGACPQYFFLERYAESFLVEMHQFVDVVLGRKQLVINKEVGLKALQLASCAYQSIASGRVVKRGVKGRG